MKDIRGKRYASVTEILAACNLSANYNGVPTATLEHAAARGRALHATIKYHAEGTLDPDSLHQEVLPGFHAYLLFCQDRGWVAHRTEFEIVNESWGVVGHPDALGTLSLPAGQWLLDYKYMETVDLKASALQLAAYRWLYEGKAQPLDGTAIVQLKRDGTYRFHPVQGDPQVFQAAVIVYHAQEAK